MKKIVSIMLALVLVFSLAACGSDKGSTETKSTETKATEATKAPETKATEAETKEETKATEAETKEETKSTDSTDAQSDESAQSDETAGETEAAYEGIGTWDGNTYTSEELGLSFDLPEGWQIAIEPTQVDATSAMEFTIMDAATNENIILMSIDLAAAGATDLTEDDYIGVFKDQVTQKGLTLNDDVKDQKLGDDTYKALAASGSQDGKNFNQLYLVHKGDGKMFAFVVTGLEDSSNGIDEFFASCKSIN